jgi:sulfite reductase (NADPH) flavoprotein alpha-component
MTSQPRSAASKGWSPPGGWLLWAGAAGIPAAYWLISRGDKRVDEATSFDSFLRAPVPVAENATTQKTDFNSFLRVQTVQPCSTDFGSFLRDRVTAAPAHDVQEIKKQAEEVPADSAPVLVMFGTEYGFSKEIAEKLCQQLKDSGKYWCAVTVFLSCLYHSQPA